MPLTVKNVDSKEGRFEVVNEAGMVLGHGRAKASKRQAGMITLFFPEHVISQIINGIRVPIDWLSYVNPTVEEQATETANVQEDK